MTRTLQAVLMTSDQQPCNFPLRTIRNGIKANTDLIYILSSLTMKFDLQHFMLCYVMF